MKSELQNFLDMLDNADVNHTEVKEPLDCVRVLVWNLEFLFDDCGRLLEVVP